MCAPSRVRVALNVYEPFRLTAIESNPYYCVGLKERCSLTESNRPRVYLKTRLKSIWFIFMVIPLPKEVSWI